MSPILSADLILAVVVAGFYTLLLLLVFTRRVQKERQTRWLVLYLALSILWVLSLIFEADFPFFSFSLLVFMLLLAWRGGVAAIQTRRLPLHLLRGAIGVGSPFFFFLALPVLPLAEATALFFSAIFMMTALSALCLSERVGLHRWTSIAVGFVGVLIVTRPGSDAFQFEAVYALLGSLFYALFILTGRWMSATESTFSLVFYFHLVMALLCSVPMLWLWQPLSAELLIALLLATLLALLAHFSIVQAFRLAPVAVLAPFEFSALLWALLLDYTVWRALPDKPAIVGAVVIVCCGLYIVRRESKKTGL